ncbi:MAG: SH3 domain-containing protein [Campylobacterota bacterium]|nr:SH3 domain-containing protein [Campylobacterota bacterium]
MNKRLFFTLLLSIQTLLLADYTLVDGKRASSKIDHMPKNKVADMSKVPQDPAYYAKQIKTMPYSKQLKLDKEYNKKFFKPWSLKKMDKPLSEMTWPFRSVSKGKIYDSKGRIISSSTYRQWTGNANFSKLDSIHQRGITTKHINVRALPTRRPFYHNPRKAGEGFPFDYNQNTSYHMNTPLYISHYSKDRKWAYVRGSAAYGWIEVSGMAVVNSDFIKKFKNKDYAVVVRDNLKLYNDKKQVSIVKLGSIFPVTKVTIEVSQSEKKKGENEKKSITKTGYLFAERGSNGKAILKTATVQKSGMLAKKPIAFTPQNAAMIAKQFYNEPYGWGGLLQTRDCSSTTKDYFSVFGIFLRRNSSKQAKDGYTTNIRGISKSKKKKTIISKAKPFQSLLYVPGHIVLYMGHYKGEPVIMHTYWGARLKNGSKHVLGRTVVTTTEPGKELRNIKETSKLANTLQKIVTFGG